MINLLLIISLMSRRQLLKLIVLEQKMSKLPKSRRELIEIAIGFNLNRSRGAIYRVHGPSNADNLS